MNEEKVAHRDNITFELSSGSVLIDEDALKSIKQAMVSFFHASNPDFPLRYVEAREFFAAELSSSALWLNETSAEIGVWKLENQGGSLVLVRYPKPDGDSYIFHAKLKRYKSGWVIVSLEHEREFGP